MKVYNKLVRDKVPDKIKNELDGIPKTRILSEEEYKAELYKKLVEEAYEFIAESDIEEMADILEIIHAILELNKYNLKDVEKIRKNKLEERGGFIGRIFLESVEPKSK